MNNPRESTNLGADSVTEKFKLPLALLAIVIVGLCVYYVYTTMKDQYTVKPEKLFSRVFTNSFYSVSDFKGGGEISAHSDKWMYFKMTGEADLKEKTTFMGEDPAEVARRWFIQILPDKEGLKPEYRRYLKIKSKVDSRTDHIMHEWYLFNWKTDEHFYREWGY